MTAIKIKPQVMAVVVDPACLEFAEAMTSTAYRAAKR